MIRKLLFVAVAVAGFPGMAAADDVAQCTAARQRYMLETAEQATRMCGGTTGPSVTELHQMVDGLFPRPADFDSCFAGVALDLTAKYPDPAMQSTIDQLAETACLSGGVDSGRGI